MGDAKLRLFLRDSAHVDKKILDKTMSILEVHEVFNIQGLEAIASLPDFDTCGLGAVTKQLIRKALARRGGGFQIVAKSEAVAGPSRLDALTTMIGELKVGQRAKVVHGETVRWNEARGFGFVRADDQHSAIFCHHTALRDASYLEPGSRVSFVVVETPEPGGTRFRAEQVMLIAEPEGEAPADIKPRWRRPRKV